MAATACSISSPADLKRNADDITIQLTGGKTTVDGVTVVMHTPHSNVHLDSGKTHLLVATLCPGGITITRTCASATRRVRLRSLRRTSAKAGTTS
jgi:hypothetical protein